MRVMRGVVVCAAGCVLGMAGRAAGQSADGQTTNETLTGASQPAASAPTSADGHAPTVEEASKAATEARDFKLSFAPYAWFCGVDGKTGTGGVTLDVDKTFWDIFQDSDSVFGLMGALDMSYKGFVFQITGSYTQVEMSDGRGRARSGPLGGGLQSGVNVHLKAQTGIYEAMGGIRLVETKWGKDDENAFTFDGFVGIRFNDMDLNQDVSADVNITLPDGRVLEAGKSKDIDDNQGWIDPFIGVRTEIGLGQHWAIVMRGDVGGFDVDGDQFAWQALGAIGYRWPQEGGGSIDMFAGYRALSQDYTNDDFTWDAFTLGPILGAQFVWRF